MKAAELQRFGSEDRHQHGHVGAVSEELRIRRSPVVPINDEKVVVDQARLDLAHHVGRNHPPNALRQPVRSGVLNQRHHAVDPGEGGIEASAPLKGARDGTRRRSHKAEMFGEQGRTLGAGRFMRLRSALKLMPSNFGDQAALSMTGDLQLVDEQCWFGFVIEYVGFEQAFQRFAATADQGRVVDRRCVVLVGRRAGDVQIAKRVLVAVGAALGNRQRVIRRRHHIGDMGLTNDLTPQGVHSNHGVSRGAVWTAVQYAGLVGLAEGFWLHEAMSYGHAMDFDFEGFDHPMRAVVRDWIAAHPQPSARQLAEAGYVAPHWPAPYGLGADPIEQLVIDQELRAAGIRRPSNPIGIGWSGPTILHAGSDEQKDRYLLPMLAGEEIWCQMFSEPEAGSDLAALATRAVRDGDEYVINGSKIWTSGGHHSQFGILLARTDPDVSKHRGISYFICPTDLPGLTMSPIIDMTTAHSFNECFFDDVRIPASLRVGEEGDGWRLAKVTLSNERVQLSSSGSLWGAGPSASHLLDLVRESGGCDDPVQRQRLAGLHAEAEVLRLNRLRTLSSRLAGRTPGPEASIQKIMADEHGQHVMEVAKDLVGPAGMLEGSGPAGRLPTHAQTGATEINLGTEFDGDQAPWVDPVWHYGYLFSPALTLGGGTFAVQRNIVAEKVLGLPREPDVEQGLSWSESRRAG